MAYHAFALIHADCDIDLDMVTQRLAHRLRHMAVVRRANSIDVSYRGWSLLMDFVAEPHVVAESSAIAERFGDDRPDREQIARCPARIEVATDPDPQTERFNDYVAALDVLYNCGNIVLFDPANGTFI